MQAEKLYVTIISKLIDTDWHETIHGGPSFFKDMEIFVDEIIFLIPELRGYSIEEIDNYVLSAVQYASENWCFIEKSFEPELPQGIYNGIRLYKCSHTDIGNFYLIIAKSFFPVSFSISLPYGRYSRLSGEEHFAFYLTRDIEKAESEYKDMEDMTKDEERIIKEALAAR